MPDLHSPNRRRVLQSVAGVGLSTLAGCSAGSSSSNGSSGAIRDVAVDETVLRVRLGEQAVETVNVIAPDGTVFASRPVSTGASAVEFDLLAGSAYTPGTHSVVASAGGEQVGTTDIDLVPDLRIETVGVAQNHPEMDWDKSDSELSTFVRLENSGTAPESAVSLIFENVPNPTDKTNTAELHSRSATAVPPSESKVVRPFYSPFMLTPWGVECGTTTEMRVKVGTSVGEDVAKEMSLSLKGEQLGEDCNITIGENGSR